MANGKPACRGKKENQKMKPYLVMKYLLQETCEGKVKSGAEICEYLFEECGIEAERRSVYTDIEAINNALYIAEHNTDIFEAEEAMKNEENRYVLYDPHKKGFYVKKRLYDEIDIRIIAECIYSSHFLDEAYATHLLDIVCGLLGENKIRNIKHSLENFQRVKSTDKALFEKLRIITKAMAQRKKISFNATLLEAKGKYIVREEMGYFITNPHSLFLKDGIYYLLCGMSRDEWTEGYSMANSTADYPIECEHVHFRPFRIDSIDNLKLTDSSSEPLPHLFSKYKKIALDGNTYISNIRIAFDDYRIQDIVDRFGIENIMGLDEAVLCSNSEDGEWNRGATNYCSIYKAEINEDFFGWLVAKNISVLAPDEVVNEFNAYLEESVSAQKDRMRIYKGKFKRR